MCPKMWVYMYVYIHLHPYIRVTSLRSLYTHTHRYTHIYTHIFEDVGIYVCIYVYIYIHIYTYCCSNSAPYKSAPYGHFPQKSPTICGSFAENDLHIKLQVSSSRTGWRRSIGCLNMQVISRKRATNCRALLRKMTHEDQASYESSPPSTWSTILNHCTADFWEFSRHMMAQE